MKKFYATIAIAAVALSASAQQLYQAAPRAAKSVDPRLHAEQMLDLGSSQRHKVPSIQPVIDVDDITGYYIFSYQGETQNDTQGVRTEVECEIFADSGYDVTISGLFSEDITATVDVYSSTLSISFPQALWTSSKYGEVSAYHYYYDYTANTLVETTDAVVATFDKATGTLTFDEEDVIGEGLADLGGWFWLGDAFAAQKKDNPFTATEGWDDVVGTATFVDGWIMPTFYADNTYTTTLNPADYPYAVKVQVNQEDKNLVRLVNPYENSPIASANYADDFNGYIVMDLTDPDFVLVRPRIYAGIDLGDDEDGNMAMYLYNLAGYYHYIGGYDVETLKNYYSLGYVTYGANKDAAQPSTYANDVVTINEPGFGFTGKLNSFYTWNNVTMQPVITLPDLNQVGISDVAVDSNSSCEFFNLQGIRVENPVSGQIYIRRQGNTATKVVVK